MALQFEPLRHIDTDALVRARLSLPLEINQRSQPWSLSSANPLVDVLVRGLAVFLWRQFH
jgi:hypothetical protein